MRIDYPVTILSDLHVGHPASYVTDPEELAPLFRDTATAIFNGDTVEMLWLVNREKAQEQMERISHTCIAQGARPVYLNGNHDPVISSASYLDLAAGAVLVTHGDILFHAIAPWGREAALLAMEHTRILEGMDHEDRTDFEKRLVAIKRTSLALEMHEPPVRRGRWARLSMALREGWPPWRAFRIIRFWMQTPRLAAELAARFRPEARFVLIGHTHYAGVWRRGDRIVVNTGSFLPFSGRYAVRIDRDRLEVRKVVRGKGGWELGRTVAVHALGTQKEGSEQTTTSPGWLSPR
jgi:UDP-2,3-diacylglucosamine pyrophosphatase LpxH